MNLKILFMLLFYWSCLSIISIGFFTTDFVDSGYSVTGALNDSELGSGEVDTGGSFLTGVDFGRYLVFMVFGIGFPIDTPNWFLVIFAVWQTILTIFTAGFIISSVWDG